MPSKSIKTWGPWIKGLGGSIGVDILYIPTCHLDPSGWCLSEGGPFIYKPLRMWNNTYSILKLVLYQFDQTNRMPESSKHDPNWLKKAKKSEKKVEK